MLAKFPSDDARLVQWGLGRPEVSSFHVERAALEIRIRAEGSTLHRLIPLPETAEEMVREGYEIRGFRGGSLGLASDLPKFLMETATLVTVLAGTQFALGWIGYFGRWYAERQGVRLPRLFGGSSLTALVLGGVSGAGFLLLGQLYSEFLKTALRQAVPSPWNSLGAMTASAKWLLLLFGALGAPLAEEIFFRGYLFARFKAEGQVGFGIAASALLFGVVHFTDPYNIPIISLYGVILAWLYHRTGSLLAPLAAHVVNNGVSLLLLLHA